MAPIRGLSRADLESALRASNNRANGLEEALAKANGEARDARRERHEIKEQADKDCAEARKEHSDLKERLYNSEMENQRLRGYISRVQEDDTVREDLIATGDPDGETQMVPKRKSTIFHRPSDVTDFGERAQSGIYGYRDGPPRPRHWISYLIPLAFLLWSFQPADATECPQGAPSCKVITITPDEEQALTAPNGILATAERARFLDLSQAVVYFRQKLQSAPAGEVKTEEPKQ